MSHPNPSLIDDHASHWSAMLLKLLWRFYFLLAPLLCVSLLAQVNLVAEDASSNNDSLPSTLRWSDESDRSYYWIPAIGKTRVRGDRELANLPAVERDAVLREQKRAEKLLQMHIVNTPRPWSNKDAAEIYRQINWLAHLGSRDNQNVRAVGLSTMEPMTISVQARVPQNHPTMRWPPSSYAKVESQHFEITTQGTPALAIKIAELAEQTYAVWQQAFFAAWCDAHELELAVLESKPFPSPSESISENRLKIVLFKNRDQYLRGLRESHPNIGISTGFYHPTSKTVYCYWEEGLSANVLKHEITHQLFSEASLWEPIAVDTLPNNFWVVEGIALYMESMQIDPSVRCDRATLGGWDATRLQPARYRRLHDEFWIPWPEFSRASSSTFQQGDSVRQFYSQAAGLTHLWMDHSKASRASLVDFICDLYQQKASLRTLAFTQEDDVLRAEYDQFLLSAESRSREMPPRASVRDLVLSRTNVDSMSLLHWPESLKLKLDWLDLSFTKIDDQLWSGSASGRWDTRRLNVEGTSVGDSSLAAIAAINRLEELDLSSCKITDTGLESLRNHRGLRKLWLTNTEVTDRSIDLLGSLPRLEEVELTGTQLTDKGLLELGRKNPRLKRK